MELKDVISGAQDVVSVKRVYGDPYEKNGLTVIPAATVRFGGGGGGTNDEGAETEPRGGGGGGFGLVARPSGAWVIENGDATWRPAIDVNRIVLGGQVVALTAILVTGRIMLVHSRRQSSMLNLISLAGLISRVPSWRRTRSRMPKRIRSLQLPRM